MERHSLAHPEYPNFAYDKEGKGEKGTVSRQRLMIHHLVGRGRKNGERTVSKNSTA
jgi:hypothetical protein